jgi:transcriptional regulator with XRE-family HTH domain
MAMTDLEFKKIIAELSRIKQAKKLNQKQLAAIAGTSQSTISDWLMGSKPRFKDAKKSFSELVSFFKLDYLICTQYGLIDLPQPTKTPIFKAKPKTTVSDFVRCGNDSIVEIQSGKVFTESQFNELFEVVA